MDSVELILNLVILGLSQVAVASAPKITKFPVYFAICSLCRRVVTRTASTRPQAAWSHAWTEEKTHREKKREKKQKKTCAREKKTYIVNGISKWEQEKVEHCKATLKNCFFFLKTFSWQVLRIEEKFQAECSTLYQTKINEINDINEIKSSKDKRHDTAASQTTTAKVSKSASKSPRCNQRQDKDNYTCAGCGGGA